MHAYGGKYPRREKWLPTVIFFFFLSVYLLTSSGQLVIIDENVMYNVSKNIVEKGRVDIPQEEQSVPYRGKFYTHYPIGTSIIMVPFYIAGRFLNQYIPGMPGGGMAKAMTTMISPLIMALTCLVFYFFARLFGYGGKLSVVLTLIYGLATMTWSYSKYIFGDVPAGLFSLSGIYILAALNRQSKEINYKNIFLSGLFLGLSAACRYEMILFIPPAALYLLFILRKRAYSLRGALQKIGIFCAPIAMVLFLLGLYNFIRFESWIETGSRLWGRLNIYPFGLSDVTRELGVGSPSVAFIIGIYAFLFSPGKSLFVYSPVLLIALFGLKKFYREFPYEAFLFIALFLVKLIFHSNLVIMHTGGWCWGPRFLLTTLPFLILPFGSIFQKWPAIGKPLRLVMIVIILCSLCIQIASVSVDFQRYILEYKKARGIDYNENQDMEWGRLIYDIRYSPLLGQFSSLAKVLRNMASGRTRQFKARFSQEELSAMGKVEIDLNSLQLNSLNFWWVKLYYLGFVGPALIIPVVFLCVLFCFSLLYIYSYIRKPSAI